MKANHTAIAKTLALVGLLAVAIFVGFNPGTASQNQEVQVVPLSQGVEVNPIISQVEFRFDVYCPIDSYERLAKLNEVLGLNKSVINVNLKRNRNFYVVIAKAQPLNDSATDSAGALYYCGLARKWWEYDCQNAEIVCSIPGPIFRFQRKEKATIMWINDIYAETVNWSPTECYSPTSDNMFCTVSQKELSEKCTYFKPTDYIYKTLTHRITKDSIPISPHIHGLEVRPTFDGNPLGWFNTNGQKGPGYNTLLNQKYYCLFNNPVGLDGVSIDPQIRKRSKIIQVPNDQNPGMLFYHDHAMKSTKYNVASGLAGVYIIYDKYIESRLPRGPNQKVVVFAKQGDARVFVSKSGVTENAQHINENLYRIRMINAHFDDIFYNISFSTYYRIEEKPDGSCIYTELDPTSSPDFDLTANQYKIPFTVIGTDGSLFRDPVYGIDKVSLGSGERVDILINFRQNMPDPIQFIYIVCYDNNEGKYVVKHRFNLPWNAKKDKTMSARILKEQSQNIVVEQETQATPQNPLTDAPSEDEANKPLKLNVPFSDLSAIPDKQISVKRHRPLFSLPRDMNFMIGAHYMFDSGASENPQIGTVQDIYIVNNLWQAHPIHFHLINFQTVRGYSLKQLPQNPQCTFYMLDFLRKSGLPQLQLNNADLCGYIWSLNETEVHQIFMKMNDYSREDVIGSDRNSGLNTMTPYDGNTEYLVDGCEFNTIYKYVCGNTTKDIEPYYRRWKDTSLVPPFTVYVFRMRWASNTYDPKVRSYPFFNIPEDDIIEFPGYVYHCHILPHQDNEMMRPIMLSHSDRYLQQQQKRRPRGSCSRSTWLASMKCINERMGCAA